MFNRKVTALAGLIQFAEESLGIKLFRGQRDVLAKWAKSGKRKALLALGRRAGKDLMAAIAAVHNALILDYSGQLRPGERRFIIVVATRIEQAREFIRVVKELLANAPDQPLRALVDDAAS